MKHDQSRLLSELNAQLEKRGFYKTFPPPGVEVASWYVMMGVGQVVTLRLPASRLPEVNRIFETTAWGAITPNSIPPMSTRRSASRSSSSRAASRLLSEIHGVTFVTVELRCLPTYDSNQGSARLGHLEMAIHFHAAPARTGPECVCLPFHNFADM
jgi:hypothetical protein